MKRVTVVIFFLSIITNSVNAVEMGSAVKTLTLSEYSENIDKMRGDIDYWTEVSSLEGTKKSALKDRYENLIIEREISQLLSVEVEDTGVWPVSDQGYGSEDSDEQIHILEGAVSDAELVEGEVDINQGEDELVEDKGGVDVNQGEDGFFEKLQDYLASSSLHGAEEFAQEPRPLTPATTDVDSAIGINGYLAKIISSTDNYVKVEFALDIRGVSKPIYLVKKVFSDSERLNLHVLGKGIVSVRVVDWGRREVTMSIDGQTVIAE